MNMKYDHGGAGGKKRPVSDIQEIGVWELINHTKFKFGSSIN